VGAAPDSFSSFLSWRVAEIALGHVQRDKTA
jgi:hypothetical protein